ncbi:hypothetical protein H2204_007508 [Knufia peltigerae]|uniref:Carboxylesterase type B domain-containing protein n=1 Tax=Knufia peltigerae TaxID=1002370 RepID=A0AA39CWY0_9EURO|nr:hypothetical protein H2204_007508 [Knufia peltigerae]
MSEHVLAHATIGPIQGISKTAAVTQYLGIQYASLKDRFARGELLLSPPNDHPQRAGKVLDATKPGPSPLLPHNACKDHQATIVQRHLPFEEWEQSDLHGLTINVYVPDGKPRDKLPVFVFVCGGGFTSGSGDYPEYDLGRITKMSADLGTPMVSVGLNYRVGVPGFLYSSALEAQGYKANNGLDDQRLAFRWIQHNIAGFAGDPTRVTFVGESAGAVSGWFHLQSPEPLFHQIVAMSGSSFLRPRPLALLEKGFARAAAELGAKDASPEDQVKRLVEAPKEDIIVKLGRKIPVGPFLDGDLVRTTSSFKDLVDQNHELSKPYPALQHCKRVIMGDCQMDGMGFDSRVRNRTDILPHTLSQSLSTVFNPIDPKIAPAIVSAYGLDANVKVNSRETTKPCLDFTADVSFALPTRYLTRAWAASSVADSKAYLCHFNSPNPWDGAWKGHATHALDIIFVLQNFHEQLSSGQRLCAERYAKDLIAFVNGAEPWPAYDNDKQPGAMIYYAPIEGEKDESVFVPKWTPETTGRTNFLVDLVGEDSLDKLVQANQMFLVGPL